MTRNKIPLCAFIGILAIVFGLFFLTIGLLIVSQIRGRVEHLELAGISLPFIIGGSLLLAGIGLLKRKQWARKVINFILFACTVVTSVIVYFLIKEMLHRTYWRDIPVQIGLVVFAFSTLIGLFLFMNNTRVIDELTNKRDNSK